MYASPRLGLTGCNSHPIHPGLVHWPFAFLTLASGLDILYGATTILKTPVLTQHLAPHVYDIGRAGFYLHGLALVTALPAVVSGVQQLLVMIQRGGIYEQDKKTIRPKVSLTLIHAATNDIAFGLSAYMFFARRQVASLQPDATQVLVSAVSLLLVYVPHRHFERNRGLPNQHVWWRAWRAAHLQPWCGHERGQEEEHLRLVACSNAVAISFTVMRVNAGRDEGRCITLIAAGRGTEKESVLGDKGCSISSTAQSNICVETIRVT